MIAALVVGLVVALTTGPTTWPQDPGPVDHSLVAPAAVSQALPPPGYRENEWVGGNRRGSSWCVGPGQRLLLIDGGSSSATAVVIDQSSFSTGADGLRLNGC